MLTGLVSDSGNQNSTASTGGDYGNDSENQNSTASRSGDQAEESAQSNPSTDDGSEETSSPSGSIVPPEW